MYLAVLLAYELIPNVTYGTLSVYHPILIIIALLDLIDLHRKSIATVALKQVHYNNGIMSRVWRINNLLLIRKMNITNLQSFVSSYRCDIMI